MKKIIKLTSTVFVGLFLLLSITSCNNDDDDTYTDPVIGTWNVYAMDGKVASECMQKSELTFSANGDYSVMSYAVGTDGTCAVQNMAKGVWKNKGNGTYSIQITGHSERDAKIVFSDSNNTLTSSSTRIDEGITTTLVSVFKRK